jgi:uncharacterized protein (TIGR00369 family)
MKRSPKGLRAQTSGPCLRHYSERDRFGEWLGYEVDRFDRKRKRAEAKLTIRPTHLSPAGRVHGGVVSALFDVTFGAAVFTTMGREDLAATVEIKVNYLRLIELGDRLRLKARVIFQGKRLCVVEGFLYVNGAREPSAMATGTFNVVRRSG